MFRTILAVAAALWATSAAHAAPADPETENRQRVAAMIEWMVAHCAPEGVPAMAVAMGAMVANGSDPADMATARQWLRGKISEHYGDDTPAACSAFAASLKQS